jgi:hypothetical protein
MENESPKPVVGRGLSRHGDNRAGPRPMWQSACPTSTGAPAGPPDLAKAARLCCCHVGNGTGATA